MSEWAILYEDGRWFRSSDGAYWQAPRYGVQAVLQADDNVGAEIVLSGEEHSPDGWWIWKEGRWFGTDRAGADAYRLCHMHPEQATLQGTWIHPDRWQEVCRIVQGVKTGRYPHEKEGASG